MRREKKKGVEGMRKFLSILMVLMLVFTFLPRIPISFGATLAGSVTIKDITLTPDTVGEITRIDIKFNLFTAMVLEPMLKIVMMIVASMLVQGDLPQIIPPQEFLLQDGL